MYFVFEYTIAARLAGFTGKHSMRRIERIYVAVDLWQERPFIYGESDCCHFVNHIYQQVDNKDFMFYPYGTEEEAARLLEQYGSLSEAVSFGVAQCHVDPEWLHEGDLALWRCAGREGLGIVMNPEEFVTVREPDGKLLSLPRKCVAHGWRMGSSL